MNILLILLAAQLAAILFWGAITPAWLYRFPVLFAAAFAGFALPQMIGLSNENSSIAMNVLPEGSLDIVTLTSIFCVFAVLLGDWRGVTHPGSMPVVKLDGYDPNRLTQVAIGLTVSGFLIFQVGVSMLDQDYLDRVGSQWTGPLTILAFFSLMQRYGLALCLLVYFRWRSPIALVAAVAYVVSQVLTFVWSARRGSTADMVFIVMLGLYFGRRIRLPAWLLGLILAIGTFWSNSIGEFRGHDELSFVEKIERANLFGDFGSTLTNGGVELTSAAVTCWAVEHEADYDYGLTYWNQLVHAYFPGQIFGYDLKRNLMIPERDQAFEVCGYVPPVGSTVTGMCDAFRSFWYFGCIKFYVIGYAMGRWWNRANRGDIWAQLAYMTLTVSALHSVSHGTYWLLTAYIHMCIFAFIPLYWARAGHSPSGPALVPLS